MKLLFHYLVSLLLSLVLYGCTTTVIVKKNIEGLETEQISIIKTDHETDNYKISIFKVDDELTMGYWKQLWYGKWPDEVLLSSGKHQVHIAYGTDPRRLVSWYIFELNMLPDHTYIIRNQALNSKMSIWLEDLNTQESAGKVLASENEPLTSRNRILDHTDAFTFQTPQDKKWIILNRNSVETKLYRKGPNLDDRYFIKIGVMEDEKLTENHSSVEVFINDFKKRWLKHFDDRERYSVISNDINHLPERGEFCLTYHTVIEDKNAQKHNWRPYGNEPMRIEKVGNICRLPQKKKTVIMYEYSFQYYPSHEDTHLQEKASNIFKLLDF